MQPETKYTKSGGVNIAYQVVGKGPIDLIYAPPWIGNFELFWEEPSYSRFLMRLASFSRLILFDKRGTGSSDRSAELPILEEQMDDIGAVMEAAGSERAALFGASEGGSQCALFAASYPERTQGLILYGTVATNVWSPEAPWVPTEEIFEMYMDVIQREWGGPVGLPLFAPSVAGDERLQAWWARLLRLAASPPTAIALLRMARDIDIRHVLRTIRVPTLILQRDGDLAVNVESGRYLARQVPGAKYVELSGNDHMPFVGDSDSIVAEVQEFLTGVRPAPEPDRVLATVLFTDIVGSTQRAAELGDRRWRDLLGSYYPLARKELDRFRGREVKTTGDGLLATFDGPARGIRCACAISDEAGQLGIKTRAGLHTGECEMIGDDVGGIAVHIGARVAAAAGPGEVMVSSTVKDLVAGSGITFQDQGVHALKGVPEEWRLFAVGRN